MSDQSDMPSTAELVRVAPGLARIAVGVGWRTGAWTLEASRRAGSRLVRAALAGEPPAQLVQEVGGELRDLARRVLGVADADERLRGFVPDQIRPAPKPRLADAPAPPTASEKRARSLRDRGAELLSQSADVRYAEDYHPAYERILSELAPDEGRILRFLALDGPQPAVDVRTSKAIIAGSSLVAPGMNMIGAGAGCRYVDRVPAYLNNLYRLGLIWFSREPLDDPHRYQVLEAQPEVLTAMRSGGRGKTVRRSIHLTPFGEDFCQVCLPLHTAELEALPRTVRSETDVAPAAGLQPAPATEG